MGGSPQTTPSSGAATCSRRSTPTGCAIPRAWPCIRRPACFGNTSTARAAATKINIIEAGLNYGWPVISHGIDYSGAPIGEGIREKEGMEQPLHYWTPSIAPSGMAFYRGDAFPDWEGDLLVGALAHRHLARLSFDAGNEVVSEVRMLEAWGSRIRDVRVRDGLIYVLTDHDPGELLRIEPAGKP